MPVVVDKPTRACKIQSVLNETTTAKRKTVMKVFSLVSSVQYEGFELIGVFASREDALECMIDKIEDFRYVDNVGIIESELGKELDMHADVEWLDLSVYRNGDE